MSRASKLIERCLWAVGLLTLVACALVWLNARLEQERGNQELDRRIFSAPPLNSEKSKPEKKQLAHDSVVGRIEIPRLAVSAVVFEGTDSPVLLHGIGHLTGSHLPGEKGNVVFAGHRDTFFRALRDIHPHDVITVTTEEGTRRYSVQSTAIVDPDQTSVLKDTPAPTLTLITCYPFYYVGQAPQRFVVRAREVVERAAAPLYEAVVAAPPPKPIVVRRRKPVLQAKAASLVPASAIIPAVAEPAAPSVESNATGPSDDADPPKRAESESVTAPDPTAPIVAATGQVKRSLRSLMNPVRFAGRIARAIRNSGQ